jgi:hypothetical protein
MFEAVVITDHRVADGGDVETPREDANMLVSIRNQPTEVGVWAMG